MLFHLLNPVMYLILLPDIRHLVKARVVQLVRPREPAVLHRLASHLLCELLGVRFDSGAF